MRSLLLATLLLSFYMGACTVNKRDPQTPAPSVKRFNTNFFFEYSEDRKTYKPRRFLFGMSVEDKSGRYRNLNMDHYSLFGSTNVEFEFSEDGGELIGRRVNPTYPNNKSKWQVLMKFRISRNYYQENRVDSSGRTSSDKVERTDKSDPRARPFVDLELTSMSFENENRLNFWSGLSRRIIQKVEDIEVSSEGDWLAFTAISTNAAVGSMAQTVDRVNLLRMDKTPSDFEQTLYHKDNDRHTQILHIIESNPNHYGRILKAVHWDINARTKKKHKIHIHNFPDEYVQVAKDSIESWNDVFEKSEEEGGIGLGYRPLEPVVWENKYHFDLRKHVIHWVSDIRLSAAGPLGLGNVAADIETGRVLWTGSIIWGGLLDRYAGRYVPSSAVSNYESYMGGQKHNLSHLIPEGKSQWAVPASLPKSGKDLRGRQYTYESYFQQWVSEHIDVINDSIVEDTLRAYKEGLDAQVAKNEIDQATADNRLAARRSTIISELDLASANDLLESVKDALNMDPVNDVDLDVTINELRKDPITMQEIIRDLGLEQKSPNQSLNVNGVDPESDQFQNLPESIREASAQLPSGGYYQSSFDTELTALEAIDSLNSGISQRMEDGEIVDVEEVKRGMIRNTITHEIGHTLGLGHNFKSNIMPEKGSVPDKIFLALEKQAKEKRIDTKGTVTEKMTNTSSIMGYPDGLTEALKKYQEHTPGFNDVSRIRYLYKQEYPMYDKTTDGKSDYVWTKLGNNGRILPQATIDGKVHTPGYLPNCNDFEASFYMDPFCNRHDRGYNARTLVDRYFARYWDRLGQTLESSIDALKTRNFWYLENILWFTSARVMNRGRLFHDHMRRVYADEINKLNEGGLATHNNILTFSQSCRDLNAADPADYNNMSADKNYGRFLEKRSDGKWKINEFGDLCIATAKYFDQINNILELEGPEYTEVDYSNRLVPGGIRSGEGNYDYGQIFGSWKRLSMMPIKFKIIQNIVLPYTTMTLGRSDYPMFVYSRPDTSFSMSTLYPKDYLKVVSSLVDSGVSIGKKNEEPKLSKSLLYLGYFMRFQTMTRDYGDFSDEILDAVPKVSRFRFSPALIQIDATKDEGSEMAKTFKGSIYNQFNNSYRETLGNVYLYTFDRVVMGAQNNSLALQVSPIRWRTPSAGVAYAIKLDYAPNYDFPELEKYSPRRYFIREYSKTLEKCVKGTNDALDNGLESYFNADENRDDDQFKYEGIKIPFNIDSRPTAYKDVHDSILLNLAQFEKARPDFDLKNCDSALKTQKTLVLGAALMMGYIFPETLKYLDMGAF